MEIRKAHKTDFAAVKEITQNTIRQVYPRYYPAGAVEFFLNHHSDERIEADIAAGKVYLLEEDGVPAGTVTVNGDEIGRLFVLPSRQRCGLGRAMLDFAEEMIMKQYDTVVLDASFPAKGIYRKRGYREKEYHIIRTDNGDYLCYDVMERKRG